MLSRSSAPSSTKMTRVVAGEGLGAAVKVVQPAVPSQDALAADRVEDRQHPRHLRLRERRPYGAIDAGLLEQAHYPNPVHLQVFD